MKNYLDTISKLDKMGRRLSGLGTYTGNGLGMGLGHLDFSHRFNSYFNNQLAYVDMAEKVNRSVGLHNLASSNFVLKMDEIARTAAVVDTSSHRLATLEHLTSPVVKHFATMDVAPIVNHASSIARLNDLTVNLSTRATIAHDLNVVKLHSVNAPLAAFDAIHRLYNDETGIIGATKKLSKQLTALSGIHYRTEGYERKIETFEELALQAVSSSDKLATFAVKKKNWDLLTEIADTAEVVAVNVFRESEVKVDPSEPIINLHRIYESLRGYYKSRKFRRLLVGFCGTLGFLFACHQEYVLVTEPDPITKEDIAQIVAEQLQKNKPDKSHLVTNRNCKVVTSPKVKSGIIDLITVGSVVNVVQVRDRWAFVTYKDIHGLAKAGWVLRNALAGFE